MRKELDGRFYDGIFNGDPLDVDEGQDKQINLSSPTSRLMNSVSHFEALLVTHVLKRQKAE
jgi:hypothetical protein